MLEWIPLFTLPNLLVKEPVEVEFLRSLHQISSLFDNPQSQSEF